MRQITQIILHCSATPAGVHYTLHDIDHWHQQRGWNGCGYHYIILLDGTIQQGRPLEIPGAHCMGHNAHSIGICYIGGLDAQGNPSDTRTPEQRNMLWSLIQSLKKRFPKATIHGHNEFAPKSCPCFDVPKEYPSSNNKKA